MRGGLLFWPYQNVLTYPWWPLLRNGTMHLMKPLTFALITIGLFSCTPETYLDPIPGGPDAVQVKPETTDGPAAFTSSEVTSDALPDLRMDTPYSWTGCHGEGRMTFRADSTMTWDIDGQVFDSPYLLDKSGDVERLYPGCSEGCEEMIAYRYDDTEKAWRQWDGFCWYDLKLVP